MKTGSNPTGQPEFMTGPVVADPSDDLMKTMEEDALSCGVADEGDDDGDFEADPLSGVAFGPSLIEQLLYGIIVAHPLAAKAGAAASKTNKQRLNAAMKALLGRRRSRTPLPADVDDKALLWMKERQLQHLRKRLEISDRQLAMEATAKFFRFSDTNLDMSVANRLREKFSGVYEKKQAKGLRSNASETLRYRVSEHDYIVESVERQILRRIVGELRVVGVAVTLLDD